MYYSINHGDDLDALHGDGEEIDELVKVGKIATGTDEPLKALRQPHFYPCQWWFTATAH
jgi:hypothetical protein